MSSLTEQQRIKRAQACKPKDVTSTINYCQCGRYYESEQDWRSRSCKWCLTETQDGRGGKR